MKQSLRHISPSSIASRASRSERELVVLITGLTWAAATVAIETLSYVHGLSPSHPNAWRFGLGIPSALFIVAILVYGPRLGPRGTARANVLVSALGIGMLVTVLAITPATFAVLVALLLPALAAAYFFDARGVLIVLVALTVAALAPLYLDLPGHSQSRAPAWLAVFLPVLWATAALVHARRMAVTRALADVREQSLTDPLTGLRNVRGLREAAEAQARTPAAEGGRPAAHRPRQLQVGELAPRPSRRRPRTAGGRDVAAAECSGRPHRGAHRR